MYTFVYSSELSAVNLTAQKHSQRGVRFGAQYLLFLQAHIFTIISPNSICVSSHKLVCVNVTEFSLFHVLQSLKLSYTAVITMDPFDILTQLLGSTVPDKFTLSKQFVSACNLEDKEVCL